MNNKWRYIPFTDVFDWCSKSNIGSREAVENGKYKLFVASATEIKRYNEFLENGERIVFGTGGNPCIHYVNEAFSYTNHTECARSKSEDVFVKFYYYYFQKDGYKDLQSTFVGGGIKNSSKKKIGSLLVPQIDYDEQKRIVAKIEELFSELDNGVETLKKTKQQLAVYRQAVLKEAFEGKFTIHTPCYVELPWASKENTQSLPDIPQEWQYIALSNLGDLGRGKSKHRPRNDPKLFEGGKYPFLQTGEVKAAKQYITEYSKMYGEFGLQQSNSIMHQV